MTLQELRKYRFLSLSAIDFFGTIIIATVILYILSKISNIEFNFSNTVFINLLAILLGVIVHKILGVNTRLNYIIGLSDKP